MPLHFLLRSIFVAVDLIAWEKEHGEIPDNAAVLVNSDWSRKYGTAAYTDIVRDDSGRITGM